jgi:hypothetical protein
MFILLLRFSNGPWIQFLTELFFMESNVIFSYLTLVILTNTKEQPYYIIFFADHCEQI